MEKKRRFNKISNQLSIGVIMYSEIDQSLIYCLVKSAEHPDPYYGLTMAKLQRFLQDDGLQFDDATIETHLKQLENDGLITGYYGGKTAWYFGT
jgi:DNA-binding PadR family transcriptional regulator